MEFYKKAFFVGLAILVGYLLLLVLQPIAGSMAWAIFLAFILYPLHRWLTRKLKNRQGGQPIAFPGAKVRSDHCLCDADGSFGLPVRLLRSRSCELLFDS